MFKFLFKDKSYTLGILLYLCLLISVFFILTSKHPFIYLRYGSSCYVNDSIGIGFKEELDESTVTVVYVQHDSISYNANLLEGDIITEIEPSSTSSKFEDMLDVDGELIFKNDIANIIKLYKYKENDTIKMTVKRDGREEKLTLKN